MTLAGAGWRHRSTKLVRGRWTGNEKLIEAFRERILTQRHKSIRGSSQEETVKRPPCKYGGLHFTRRWECGYDCLSVASVRGDKTLIMSATLPCKNVEIHVCTFLSCAYRTTVLDSFPTLQYCIVPIIQIFRHQGLLKVTSNFARSQQSLSARPAPAL